MKFGKALEAIKSGKRVKRLDWDISKKFIFMQIPSIINKEIVPKMQSLPHSVKNYFIETFNDPTAQMESIYYTNQLAIVRCGNIIEGYAPTAQDVLEDDWVVLD